MSRTLVARSAIGYKGPMPALARRCSVAFLVVLAVCACGDDGAETADAGGDGRGTHDAGVPDATLDGGAPAAPVVCDVVAPTKCVGDPRFADIDPILMNRCYDCHDGKHEQWPLTDYSHVASWFSQLRDVMTHCTMPPADAGIDMPTEEREALLMWLRCGFKQ